MILGYCFQNVKLKIGLVYSKVRGIGLRLGLNCFKVQ